MQFDIHYNREKHVGLVYTHEANEELHLFLKSNLKTEFEPLVQQYGNVMGQQFYFATEQEAIEFYDYEKERKYRNGDAVFRYFDVHKIDEKGRTELTPRKSTPPKWSAGRK